MIRSKRKIHRVLFEAMESRTLCSASPLVIAQATVYDGAQLQITGTTGSDNIAISQSSAGITVSDAGFDSKTIAGKFASIKIVGNGGNDTIIINSGVTDNCMIYGGRGNDTITDNGSGNDQMWGGGGTDSMQAGKGNDTLVSVGDTGATLVGGTGVDSFWMDNKTSEKATNVTAAETAGGNVHQITNYLEKGATLSPTTITVGRLILTVYTPPTGSGVVADPTGSGTYTSESANPLFSDSGPSESDVFQGSVGDCYFMADLAAVAKADPNRIRQSICDLGDGTYAVVRTGADTYASIGAGLPGDGMRVVGATGITSLGTFSNGTQLLNNINSDLLKGEAVTYAMGGHVYTVDSVDLVAGTLKLRNQVGGGSVTLTAQAAYSSYAAGAVAKA